MLNAKKFLLSSNFKPSSRVVLRLYTTAPPQENRDTAIHVVKINNPTKRNALSKATLEDLINQFNNVPKDSKVVILKSDGPVFSSGHDLKELKSCSVRSQHHDVFRICSDLMLKIQKVPQVVIAQVQGIATAAGCQLVSTCDLAVSADNATFATPGVNIGLFCTTPGVAVARSLPKKKALEMLFTGLPITAQEALQYGLVNKIVPAAKLEEETLNLARQIAKASRETLALGKKAFYQQTALDVESAYAFASDVMADNMQLEDTQEGISAFIEKRHPHWKQ